jgi:tryptophan synthase alpha chain
MHFVRLVTPTTDDQRLPTVLAHSSGFLYYVSIAGITGTASATEDTIKTAVSRLKNCTDLPVAVGFGIKTPEQAAAVARVADAAVVGSSIVQMIADNLDDNGQPTTHLVDVVLDFARSLADGVRGARQQTAD